MRKKKNYNALIIGSNFGYSAHCKALKKINIFNIDISSPNINNKSIKDKKIGKFKNYKYALKKKTVPINNLCRPTNNSRKNN